MLNKKIRNIIIGIIILVTTYTAGRFSAPNKIIEKKVVDEELTNEKLMEIQKNSDQKQNNIVDIKEVVNKDGSRTIEKHVDRSTYDSTKEVNINSENTQEISHTETEKIVEMKALPTYFFRASYPVSDLQGVFDYKKINVGIDYRIIGSLYATLQIAPLNINFQSLEFNEVLKNTIIGVSLGL